jgi:lipopolysaccharide/colanic/teichoic acid biosynthesis glycosyltransferase
MAEEMDKKAAKKAEKARKKAEKKAAKNMETDLENTEEEEGSSSKLAVALVTLVIIIVWLAILALLIKWDVGGFGSTVMRPLLKDIPYVNRILPDSEDDLSTEEDYPYKNMDEAVAYIKELEQELAQAQQGSSENSAYIADLEAQSQKLKEYEANEAAFEEEKEKLTTKIKAAIKKIWEAVVSFIEKVVLKVKELFVKKQVDEAITTVETKAKKNLIFRKQKVETINLEAVEKEFKRHDDVLTKFAATIKSGGKVDKAKLEEEEEKHLDIRQKLLIGAGVTVTIAVLITQIKNKSY